MDTGTNEHMWVNVDKGAHLEAPLIIWWRRSGEIISQMSAGEKYAVNS